MKKDIIESINLDNFLLDLNELLIKEKIIEIKKENNIELSKDEYFFDTYLIKPSTLLNVITKEK